MRANNDGVNNPEYKLTDEEKKIWSASIAGAGMAAPVLLSPLTMMQPYKSKLVDVSAIDESWRVALGPAFFKYSQHEREAIVVHECLHATCNHFQRSRNAGQSDPETANIAEDLEINQMIADMTRVRLPKGALYPKVKGAPSWLGLIDVPAGQTMENYYKLLDGSGAKMPPLPPEMQGSLDGDHDNTGDNGAGDNRGDQSSHDKSQDADSSGGDSMNMDDHEDNGSEDNGSNGGSTEDQSSGSGSAEHGKDAESNSFNGRDENNRGSNHDGSTGDNQLGGQSGDQRDNQSGGSKNQNDPSGMGNGDTGQQSHKHGLCGVSDVSKLTAEADEAGVRKVEDVKRAESMQKMMQETKKRLQMNGRAGVSTMDQQFLIAFDRLTSPPPLPWRRLLQVAAAEFMSKMAYVKTEYSFKRINRRGSAFMRDTVFPSMIGYAPNVMMAIDTSGSRTDGGQFEMDMMNASAILKATGKLSKRSFSAFSVDTAVKKIKLVDRIEDIDFEGGGGTDMSVAFDYARRLPRLKRPDIFVLATDGGFDWEKCASVWPQNMKVIILITDPYYMDKIPAWVYRDAKVILVAPDFES